jgi:hypothetical protein
MPLRRAVLCILILTLLLPLARAHAATASVKPSESVRMTQISELGRSLLRSLSSLGTMLGSLWPAGGSDFATIVPPGGFNGEGNGLDPHGRP